MRITRYLLAFKKSVSARARAPQNPDKVPILKMGPILPLKLRNRGTYFQLTLELCNFIEEIYYIVFSSSLSSVSGKMDNQKKVACLHEMSVLFAAMKNNDFNEKSCAKEIEALKEANIAALNKAREEKMKNSGQISTIGHKLNSQQLNRYLRKFPS